MKAHPAAEAYRMMTEDELSALAEDIKTNGQLDPIITMALDGQTVIVDGRNRFEACKLAGVEPIFEDIGDRDPITLVASRGQRRNISKGQQALAHALLFPKADKAHTGKKSRDAELLAAKSSFSGSWLSKARMVVQYAPELIDGVKVGSERLDDAYAKAVARKRDAESKAERLGRLRKGAPDLADLVDEERLTLDDALAAMERRIAEEEAAEQNRRETLLRLFVNGCFAVTAWKGDGSLPALIELFDDPAFAKKAAERISDIEGLDVPAIKTGADALTKALTALAKKAK